MLDGKRVAVVVPAYNEAVLLPETLAGIPSFADRVHALDGRLELDSPRGRGTHLHAEIPCA
jgi:hypothetical protein